MTGSGTDKVFNPEVCHLKHEGIAAEIRRNREESDQADARTDKKLDKLEAKFNALVLFLLAAVGGIMKPVVVDLVSKLMYLPTPK